MSYVKRQELFKNINPLLKKYKYDGELPPTYIGADKRAKITTYMGRSSFVTGHYEASKDLEMGNQTSKQGAEEKNQKGSNYSHSLDQRQKEGKQVKQFMNKQRIHYGNVNEETEKLRKRNLVSPTQSPYSIKVKEREEIKENTNKVNCFVDHDQPAFINSMSRTMDAYDLRMQTFGGNQTKNKEKNFNQFISEKRGFIRTSNLYESPNAIDIVNREITPRIKGPGPAFHCSYDNKYNETTAYAHDKGRVKQALNTNKHSKKALAQAEKSEYQYKLKNSSIKFDQDEFKQPLMDNYNDTSINNLTPNKLQEIDSPTFNKAVKEPQSTHFANHNTGGVHRDRNQRSLVHRDNYSVSSGSPMQQYSMKKANSFMSGKNSIVSPYAKALNPKVALKPYDAWKGAIVTQQDTVTLGQNKEILNKFDQAPRAYLTMESKISPNKADYVSNVKHYHGKPLSYNPSHVELDKGVHRLMKTTTYQIGELGKNAPNEINTQNQLFHSEKVHKEDEPPLYDKNSRRADPSNKNKILTVGFGHGAEKGTKEQQVEYQKASFYNIAHYGPQHGDFNPNVLHAINKDRRSYNLSNKFQYGLDNEGGLKVAKTPVNPEQIYECLIESAVGHNQREEIKEKLERQNFTIQHDKQLHNSEGQQIGAHKGIGIQNPIDFQALKKSSVPIKDQPGSLNSFGSVHKKRGSVYDQQRVPNGPIVGSHSTKSQYNQFKTGSTISKVPFSPEKRNRLEKDYGRFDKPNGYGQSLNSAVHSWKMPTYDLNP